jgi:hypothetical protein
MEPLWTAEARGQIHRAAEVLGADYVSGSAYEWTRFRDPEGIGVIQEFASLMQGEMFAVLDGQRRQQELAHARVLEQTRAAEAARRARSRRDAAAARLLLD